MLPAQGDWRERLPHTTIGLMSTGRNEEPIGTSATALTPEDHPHRVSPNYPARAEHRPHDGALRDSPSRPPGIAHVGRVPLVVGRDPRLGHGSPRADPGPGRS